ncbi:hypothetical protein Btru_035550 [Bulinus truncatus]|nr:hypothetical protein Btru_035550 [Bulinus truncatus]
MSQSIPNRSMSQSVPNRSMSQSVPNKSMSQSVPNRSMSQSVPNRSMSQSVLNRSMSQSVPNRSMSLSVLNGSMSQSVSNRSMSQSVPNRSMSQSVPNRSMSQSVLNRSMSQSVPNRSMSQSVPNRSMSQSVPNRSMSQSIPNRSMSQSVPNRLMSQSVPNRSMSQSIPNRSMSQSVPNRSMSQSIPNRSMSQSVPNRSMSQIKTYHYFVFLSSLVCVILIMCRRDSYNHLHMFSITYKCPQSPTYVFCDALLAIGQSSTINMLVHSAFFLLVAIHSASSALRTVCYYTNWSQYRDGRGKFVPENIDAHLCTHILYAFAKPEGNQIKPYEWNDDDMYARVMSLKNSNPSLKILLSLGGGSAGSGPFTTIVRDASSRSAFISNAISYLRQKHFDGLDVDWEFPGQNESPPSDKQKFLQLMQELRSHFESEASSSGRQRLLLTGAFSAGKDAIDVGYDIPGLAARINESMTRDDVYNLFMSAGWREGKLKPRLAVLTHPARCYCPLIWLFDPPITLLLSARLAV